LAKKDKELKKGIELATFLAELGKDTKAFNPDKGASLSRVLELLEESLATVVQKSLEDKPAVSVKINKNTGEIVAYSYLTVVGDEDMTDPYTQITVSEAKEEYDSAAEVGDEVILDDDLDVSQFGRMAMLHTKQLLSQKVKDSEREKIKEEFSTRMGELVSGDVRAIEKGNIVIDLGKTDAILPRNQQIKGDRYSQGDRVKAVIHDVKDSTKGAQVILSRTTPAFLQRLLEVEIPEIYQKTIRIVKIERNPGFRAKVALETSDSRVDPVGACLGMRGSRIQTIVRELANERIDVFVWEDDVVKLARKVLASAKISNVMPVGEKKVVLVVPDEELAKAIGKDGSNIKLTSRFLDREVLIYGEDEFDDLSEEERAKILSPRGDDIEMVDADDVIFNENSDNDETHETGVANNDENSLGAQLVENGAAKALDDLAAEK
jgi:N utilization substance protein A